jgi:putative membrane-bound dehydrogenase-like protein
MLVCFAFLFNACQQQKPDIDFSKLSDEDKRKPENAIAGLKVADGLEVTMFASEPMMTNPTNMDIDAKGRVWICEAFNYRNQLNPSNPYRSTGDRILIMEDVNGDGKADSSKVFYQGEDINAALGISVLGNKVIVSCSPNIFVFTDENGDDKADKKEILFSGLAGIQHDHAVHAFTFGSDGKLYFNFGNEGGKEQPKDKNGAPLKDDLGRLINGSGNPYRQGMVFRCNPDGSNIEILAHNFRNNYEVAVDAFGTMWQSDNDDDGNKGVRINYVMPYGNYGYTDEMTGAGWNARRTNMEEEIPKRHWHLNDPGVVPNLLQTGAGSPTGMVIYEGDLLPEKFRNQIIHSDAGPNIVRAYPITPDGAGYQATIENILDGSQGDNWFRPSDVTVAPDGSLFVADWYDPGVGGHAMGDSLRGRIYRIAPKGVKYKQPEMDLKTAEGAVKALQNPNLAVRYLAWNALHDMQEKAEPALLTLWKSENPRFRARALWLLGNIKGRGEQYVNEAIADKDENIRMTGIRLGTELKISMIPVLQKLSKDASTQVRREVALALHHNTAPEAAEIWTTLAQQYDGKDRWYLEALGIAADNQWDTFFAKWAATVGENWKTGANKDIVWRSRSKESIGRLASLITESNEKERLKYFRAFDFQKDASKTDVLLTLIDKNSQPDIALLALKHLDPVSAKSSPKFKVALARVLSTLPRNTDYLDIIQRYELKDQSPELYKLAVAFPDSSLGQEAARMFMKYDGLAKFKELANSSDKNTALDAMKIFGRVDNADVKAVLEKIALNDKKDIDLRKMAIRKFQGWNGEEKLFELVKSGKLPKELEPVAAGVLAGTWHGEIRNELSKYLKVSSADGKPLPPVAQLTKMKGSAEAGEKIFASYCTTCHVAGGKGNNFGPGLSEIGSKLAKEGLYNAILYPDAGISFGYEGFTLKMKDGSEMQGIIASKTENEYEIRLPGGTSQKIKRSDVVSQTELSGSLMPQFPMTQTEIVDLVEYLSNLKKK